MARLLTRYVLRRALALYLLGGMVGMPARGATPSSPALPPLQRVEPSQVEGDLGLDDQIWQPEQPGGDRANLLRALNYSLRYLQTPAAAIAYQRYRVPGVTLNRVRRSVERFRALVLTSRTAKELQVAVQREFVLYQSIGKDGAGTVSFTGYFEPIHQASRVRTEEFRYPLYRLPPDLNRWPRPLPTRLELEGADGLQGSQGRLRGLELVWLRDRLEAFLVQVQGSAQLQLPQGQTMTVGYAGHTPYPYTGIGRELVKAGKLKQEELNLPNLIRYFQQYPQDLNVYLPRNQRFVFFRETGGAPATGSLGFPVVAERSIATDKSLFPPGGLALIQTRLPLPGSTGQLEQRSVSRFVLDQDTGGAIVGPGRVDIFMGTGPQAGERAGLVNAPGQLYYLLLKP